MRGMKKLREYLTRVHVPQQRFAEQIGRTQGSVSRWCAGRVVPDLDTLLKIERITNGEVPVSSWSRLPLDAPNDEREGASCQQ